MKKLAVMIVLGAAVAGCMAPASRSGPYGDRDRDGVVNRADRDRDGDGVRNRSDRRPSDPTRY
jgi:Ni/Co efflux regulator RcnB